jgi:hypothetical protein
LIILIMLGEEYKLELQHYFRLISKFTRRRNSRIETTQFILQTFRTLHLPTFTGRTGSTYLPFPTTPSATNSDSQDMTHNAPDPN